jgi:hypothetical protein
MFHGNEILYEFPVAINLRKKGLVAKRQTRSAASRHTADIRIVGWAGGNRQHAGAGGRDLVLGGGGGGLGGGNCTGENQDNDEGANEMFHGNELLYEFLVAKSKKKKV